MISRWFVHFPFEDLKQNKNHDEARTFIYSSYFSSAKCTFYLVK